MRNKIADAFYLSLLLIFALTGIASDVFSQSRIKTMPGYERYKQMSAEIRNAVKPSSGVLDVIWAKDGKSFEYGQNDKKYRYDITSRKAIEIPQFSSETNQPENLSEQKADEKVERGRQYTFAVSPDGKLKAFYRDRNLWLSDADDDGEIAITTDGSEKTRVKNGSASWVYGEELFQKTAMWWSPDSKKIAFYRFDESRVPDYFLALDQTRLRSTPDVEAYPKAGDPNPLADILIYDAATKKIVRLEVRDGKPFDNSGVGHYVYRVAWSPDGKELLLNRTNRRQNIMEFTACHPETGKCRVVVHEEWLPSWTENSPDFRFLKDGKRFVWTSERTGWKNFYLYDLSGRLLATLTNHSFEVEEIVRIDEEPGFLYYTARDGDNPMKIQLHRVGLDGKGDRRLTDPKYNHTVSVAPDGRHFIDIIQTHDTPPVTRLVSIEGKVLDELAKTDLTKFDELKLNRVELLKYKAADGTTDLYGLLHFPSNFDPSKKYPLLVSVYAGPHTNGANERFTVPNAYTEYGFLIVRLDSHSAGGRGKRFLDAIYQKLGTVEVEDQAAGVKSLWNRSYIDKTRVGIFGTSYGGYVSLLALFKHPDVFRAASASSPVTAWYNYDTIYTERYMWIPQENKDGYEAGNTLNYADKLEGDLMIYYGTADNNVHPANSLQLIQALRKAGKSFDVQVGPDLEHTALPPDRMMEFFIENLVLNTGRKETVK